MWACFLCGKKIKNVLSLQRLQNVKLQHWREDEKMVTIT